MIDAGRNFFALGYQPVRLVFKGFFVFQMQSNIVGDIRSRVCFECMRGISRGRSLILARGESFRLVLSLRCKLYICCPDVGKVEGHQKLEQKDQYQGFKMHYDRLRKNRFFKKYSARMRSRGGGRILFLPAKEIRTQHSQTIQQGIKPVEKTLVNRCLSAYGVGQVHLMPLVIFDELFQLLRVFFVSFLMCGVCFPQFFSIKLIVSLVVITVACFLVLGLN